MKRILFVDDEQNVLDGLQDLLRKQRKHWEMVFCLSGPEALAKMDSSPFDVLVTDMRMPGMDGATLLQRVKEKFPTVARIMLSGHAEREAVVRAMPAAHQFLSKPCDADLLRLIIERTCGLQALLHDDSVRKYVGKIEKLPSVPRSYWELTQAVGNPQVGVGAIAEIIEKDVAMSAKVLQLVNSAYFGLPRRLTSVSQAVSYLGVELLKGLTLTAEVFATMEGVQLEGFSLERMQRSSLLTAKVSKLLLPDPKHSEAAFTAGMVHDIGHIIWALGFPKHFSEVALNARETGRPLHVVEKELMGVTHAEVGAYLLGVWGLPLQIVEAVAYHHQPRLAAQTSLDVLSAVHIADALVGQQTDPESHQDLDMALLEQLGVVANLPKWTALAKKEFNDVQTGG